MMRKFYIVFLPVCLALIAFDCQNPSVNVSTISLRNVAKCPDPDTGYISQPRKIQVIQQKKFNTVMVQTCLINIFRQVTKCGMFSHASPVSGGLNSILHKVGPEGCKEIHRFKEYRGIAQAVLTQLMPNSTTKFHVILAGSLDADGSCTGATYADAGYSWKDVVVQALISVTLKNYMATVDSEENIIHLSEGITCIFTDGYCMDVEKGETVWNIFPIDECNTHVVLYEGQGEIVTPQQIDSPRFVVIENKNAIFALSLIQRGSICGTYIWITENPQIFVQEVNVNETLISFGKQQSTVPDIDMSLYINTKFFYIEQSHKRIMHKLSAYAVHRRCLLQREILQNRLALTTLLPSWAGELIKKRPGYVGKIAGEVLYLFQCVPKMVELRRTNQCYTELPVAVDNQTYFMDPATRILRQFAEQVKCNAIIPPVYQIDNQWTSFSPLPNSVKPPTELNPNIESPFSFQPIKNLAAGGIYTTREIQQAQKAMLFGIERDAITNIITQKISGNNMDTQGLSMINLFNVEELHQLAKNSISKLWRWFTTFGTWVSGFLGIYLVLRLAKIVIKMVISMDTILQMYEAMFGLIVRVWTAIRLLLTQTKPVITLPMQPSGTPSEQDRLQNN